MENMDKQNLNQPDISISVNQAFRIDTDLHVDGFRTFRLCSRH